MMEFWRGLRPQPMVGLGTHEDIRQENKGQENESQMYGGLFIRGIATPSVGQNSAVHLFRSQRNSSQKYTLLSVC